MELYDRQATIIQISRAKAERDALLRQKRNFPTQRCSRCHETWDSCPSATRSTRGEAAKSFTGKRVDSALGRSRDSKNGRTWR